MSRACLVGLAVSHSRRGRCHNPQPRPPPAGRPAPRKAARGNIEPSPRKGAIDITRRHLQTTLRAYTCDANNKTPVHKKKKLMVDSRTDTPMKMTGAKRKAHIWAVFFHTLETIDVITVSQPPAPPPCPRRRRLQAKDAVGDLRKEERARPAGLAWLLTAAALAASSLEWKDEGGLVRLHKASAGPRRIWSTAWTTSLRPKQRRFFVGGWDSEHTSAALLRRCLC